VACSVKEYLLRGNSLEKRLRKGRGKSIIQCVKRRLEDFSTFVGGQGVGETSIKGWRKKGRGLFLTGTGDLVSVSQGRSANAEGG